MAGLAGLNGPADARLAPNFYALLGSHWVRNVLVPHVDLNPWLDEAHARGLSILGVIANESLHNGDVNMSSVEAARFYAQRYGDKLEALQVGNEWDHVSPASWTMSPQVLNHFLQVFSVEFPDTPIVLGGCADGRPEVLDDIDFQLFDYIAVHPYGRRPNNAEDWTLTPGNFGTIDSLLDGYARYGRPLWVTEIGVSSHETSELFQAHYCERMMQALMSRPDVEVAIWFCADDAMVEGFGLFDANGSPKKSAPAFMRAAGPAVRPPEPKPEPKPMTDDDAMGLAQLDVWVAATHLPPPQPYNPEALAICRYWTTHIDDMGSPCGPERPAASGNVYMGFMRGVWRWNADGSNLVERVA